MKMPHNKRLVLDKVTGRWKIIEVASPKLDASQKIRQRTSKKQRVARPGLAKVFAQ